VHEKVLLLAVAIAVSRDPGCDTQTAPGGINAPCTREKDCSSGLQCTGGVCVSNEAGPPPADAGEDAASDGSHE
jgi:hypothetical protein